MTTLLINTKNTRLSIL